MKDKYQNLEKFIFFAAVAVLIVVLLVMIESLTADKDYFSGRIMKFVQVHDTSEIGEKDYQQDFMASSDKLLTGTQLKIKRNIFEKWQPKEDIIEAPVSKDLVLQVLEIGYKPLGIEYQGRIIFSDGEIVAQINIHEQSYIVKTGSPVLDYTVVQLAKDFIKLKDKQGGYTNIKYRKKTYTNELMATLTELTSDKVQIVNKNSNFLGFKVLDIDEESVLLSKEGEHLRLRKGMVHK